MINVHLSRRAWCLWLRKVLQRTRVASLLLTETVGPGMDSAGWICLLSIPDVLYSSAKLPVEGVDGGSSFRCPHEFRVVQDERIVELARVRDGKVLLNCRPVQ